MLSPRALLDEPQRSEKTSLHDCRIIVLIEHPQFMKRSRWPLVADRRRWSTLGIKPIATITVALFVLVAAGSSSPADAVLRLEEVTPIQ